MKPQNNPSWKNLQKLNENGLYILKSNFIQGAMYCAGWKIMIFRIHHDDVWGTFEKKPTTWLGKSTQAELIKSKSTSGILVFNIPLTSIFVAAIELSLESTTRQYTLDNVNSQVHSPQFPTNWWLSSSGFLWWGVYFSSNLIISFLFGLQPKLHSFQIYQNTPVRIVHCS